MSEENVCKVLPFGDGWFDKPSLQEQEDEDTKHCYHFYPVNEFVKLPVEQKKIFLNPLIRKESIVLITGSSGVGKTMFLLGLCKSLVSGENFGNWNVENKSKVLYVDGELQTYLLQDRIKGFNIVDDMYVMSSSVDKDTIFSLCDETFRMTVKKVLIGNDIDVCVFDNLSSLTPNLDENSKKEYDPLNQYFLDLRRNGITSIIVHHTGKTKIEQRGTSGRTDNIDIWINLEKIDGSGLQVKVTYKKWRYEPIDENNNRFSMDDGYNWYQGQREIPFDENKKNILKMLVEGKTLTEISNIMVTSQPYISKLKKSFTEQGLIEVTGKITVLTENGRILLES